MRNLYEQCLKQTQFAALGFEQIFQISQSRLKKALEEELTALGYHVENEKGFLYAEGNVPILLVAHLDTMHFEPPETICYSADGAVMMPPQGIGGDDRAGVYMILRLIQNTHCHVLFCEDEETGGKGAQLFTRSGINPKANFIVELDRKGSNDAVFYQCRNTQFEQHIENFGFRTNYGSFSDISILASHFDLAAVNLSTGYYNAHQLGEYVRLDEVENLIGRVEKLLQSKTERFQYSPVWHTKSAGYDLSILQRKRMVELQKENYVQINGRSVADGRGYYMDAEGCIYLYLDDYARMVCIRGAEAFNQDGSVAEYHVGKAKEYAVMKIEEAVSLMKQNRMAG